MEFEFYFNLCDCMTVVARMSETGHCIVYLLLDCF